MTTAPDMDHHPDGNPSKRTRLSAAERRETILRAATEVFAEAGYRAGKVSDVAARVGVTEPVIFQNFGSKAALFAAVLERAAADIRASLDAPAPSTPAPSTPADTHASASALLAHVLTHPDPTHPDPTHPAAAHPTPAAAHPDPADPAAAHAGAAYGVLFADAITLTSEPELTEPARQAFRAVAAHLADLIRRAQADTAVPTAPDPEARTPGSPDPEAQNPGTPDPQAWTPGPPDPQAAAWLLLSVLSARRLRAAAMPPALEPAVTALALRALAPPGPVQHHPRSDFSS
jgi:AcrR family transcriptional regulator